MDDLFVLSCGFGFFLGFRECRGFGFWGIGIEGPLGFRIKVLGFSGKGGFCGLRLQVLALRALGVN